MLKIQLRALLFLIEAITIKKEIIKNTNVEFSLHNAEQAEKIKIRTKKTQLNIREEPLFLQYLTKLNARQKNDIGAT